MKFSGCVTDSDAAKIKLARLEGEKQAETARVEAERRAERETSRRGESEGDAGEVRHAQRDSIGIPPRASRIDLDQHQNSDVSDGIGCEARTAGCTTRK